MNRKQACAILWEQANNELVPVLEGWGFVQHPGRDAESGFDRTTNAHVANFVHEALFPKVHLLQLWVDCRSLAIMLDGNSILGDESYRSIQDVDERWDVGSANDARYFKSGFRLVKPLLRSILSGSLTYSISPKGDAGEVRRRASQVIAEMKRDMEYVRRYFFEGYRGRRISRRS